MTPDFNTMTPAQRKRLGELLIRDIKAADIILMPYTADMPYETISLNPIQP